MINTKESGFFAFVCAMIIRHCTIYEWLNATLSIFSCALGSIVIANRMFVSGYVASLSHADFTVCASIGVPCFDCGDCAGFVWFCIDCTLSWAALRDDLRCPIAVLGCVRFWLDTPNLSHLVVIIVATDEYSLPDGDVSDLVE